MKRLLVCLLLAVAVVAQSAPVYRIATPGYTWHFPADDYAHPGFATEWWYFTGNLHATQGQRYGFELTFFRISPAPGTALDHDLYFTHFAISDIGGGHYLNDERARRGDWQQAGIKPTPGGFQLWNENWQADFDASGPRRLQARWGGMAIDLSLEPGTRMLNGVNGWSQKGGGRGEASYYYSFPRMVAAGTVQGEPVSGWAWMDHEFSTNQLAANQLGWDWMGLHLSGGDLMLFNLRLADGGRGPHSAGTWRPLGGAAVPLTASDFEMTPTRRWQGYPVGWRVRVPKLGLDFTVEAALDNQEFHAPAEGVSYWEGAVTVGGGQTGEGYLELTGYRQRFNLLK